MFCPRCGDTNPDMDRFCSSCGQDLATYRQLWAGPAQYAPAPAPVPPAPWAAPVPAPAAAPPPLAPTPQTPSISSYLGWAAALMALCWPAFPAGIAALVYAGRTESRLAEGDIVDARCSSSKAKSWCWVTFGAGMVLWVVAMLLLVTL